MGYFGYLRDEYLVSLIDRTRSTLYGDLTFSHALFNGFPLHS